MLLPVVSRSAKGSYLSMGTRGSTSEQLIGGVTVISGSPETAETQTVDQLFGPPVQESGTAGPGSVSLSLILDEGSKEYQALYDLFISGGSASFNLYEGNQSVIFDNSAARVAIATAANVSTATLTLGEIPFGNATEFGTIANGHVIQMTADDSLYRINKVNDTNYNQATTLDVTPLGNASGTQAAAAYRIVQTRLVKENWQGNVTLATDFSVDATNPVVQGNVTISPNQILPKVVHIAYSD